MTSRVNSADRPSELPDTHWEISRGRAKLDYVVKRFAVATIFMINLAMLGTAIYYLVMYAPIPMEAYYLTPFAVGVVCALIYLGFPTCGATGHNVSQFTNPAVIVGKFSAYLFFGPLALMMSKMDWTAYHDRDEANEISTDLRDDSFKHVFEKHGRHFKNLMKYGFIPNEHKRELLAIYRDYKPIHRGLTKYENKRSLQAQARTAAYQGQADGVEQRWRDLKAHFVRLLPFPELPEDISSASDRVNTATLRFLRGDPNPSLI